VSVEDEDEEVSVTELLRRQGVGDDDFRVVIGATSMEYDEAKETINRSRHGYSLESARVFLQELTLALIPSKYKKITFYERREGQEVRHVHYTVDDSNHVVRFVTTMRPGEVVRVISYRRASSEDVKALETFW
jgi:uncharacterized DUF497 family protein